MVAAVLVVGALCAPRLLSQARARGRRLRREYARLARADALHRTLAAGISDLVTLHGRCGTVRYASPSATNLTGYAPDDLRGHSLAEFAHPDDEEHVRRLACASEGSASRGVVRLRCSDGRYRSFEYAGQPFDGGRGGDVVVVFRDVTERLELDAELQHLHHRYRHLAYHDMRSGLPNRDGFRIRLNEALRRARETGSGLSLLAIDIDDFKTINDSRGYAAGEELLDAFVLRLQMITHGHCELGRLGGDEFIALVADNDPETLGTLANRVVSAFMQPTLLRGHMAYITVSGGTARFPADGEDSESLLAAADIALHAAKHGGKNTWRAYTRELGRLAAQRADSLQNLRNTFEYGEFALHYQPKYSLATGRFTGYEALLRCTSETEVGTTAELIAAAEQSGFIVTLGAWVLQTAAQQSLAWRGTPFEHSIAVNVSGLQLHDRRLVPMMRDLIARDPELPQRLVLEITESALAHDVDHVMTTVDELAAMGFAMHIDDFGTGYSSLSRLSRMPVRALKIDKSFVAGTPTSAESCEIVKAVIALARALKLEVIAEGVETREQRAFLESCGCDEAQGYLFGRPMAPEDLGEQTSRRIREPLRLPS